MEWGLAVACSPLLVLGMSVCEGAYTREGTCRKRQMGYNLNVGRGLPRPHYGKMAPVAWSLRVNFWQNGGLTMRNANIRLIGLALTVTSALWSVNAQTLFWIYDADDQDTRHQVWGYSVTEDGRYVVGNCISVLENYDANRRLPFLWDRQTRTFNPFFANCSNTVGVEARDVAYVYGDYGQNDLTVVGGIPGQNASTPFVWSQLANRCHTVNTANIGFAYSLANDYIFAGVDRLSSTPKAVIWGSSWPRPGLYRKVLQNGPSEAYAIAKWISSIVVGWANNSAGQRQAVMWIHTGVRDGNPTPQYFLPPTNSGLRANSAVAVSANGRFILGNGSGFIQGAAVAAIFIWQWDGRNPSAITLQEIPTSPLSFNASQALGISADGNTIVGYQNTTAGFPPRPEPRAARWRKTGSGWVYEDLNQVYSNLLRDGSVLLVANAVSPDGRHIVGWGYNGTRRRQEAFLLTLPCASHQGDVDLSGCIDDADLLAILFAFGSTGSSAGRADTNCDGVVDDADLLTVLFNFGSGC